MGLGLGGLQSALQSAAATVANLAGQVVTALQFVSSQASGSDAFKVLTNGARWHFGTGASDYASSDGTTVTFAGPVAGANTVTSTLQDGMTMKMGGSASTASVGGVVAVRTAAVSSVGAGPDDLQSVTLPANVFTVTGRTIQILAWGTTANNANAKTVTMEFGGQQIMTQALTVSIAGTWRIATTISRSGASTQNVFAELLQLATIVHKQTLTAGTQTEGGTIVVKCTGAGVAAADVVQSGMIITII